MDGWIDRQIDGYIDRSMYIYYLHICIYICIYVYIYHVYMYIFMIDRQIVKQIYLFIFIYISIYLFMYVHVHVKEMPFANKSYNQDAKHFFIASPIVRAIITHAVNPEDACGIYESLVFSIYPGTFAYHWHNNWDLSSCSAPNVAGSYFQELCVYGSLCLLHLININTSV